MPKPVIMPKFGMDQEEGTVVQWLKQEGDEVEKGEPILEVETDKINMEVEAPTGGVLAGIRCGPGVTAAIGDVIAYILHAGEELPAEEQGAPRQPTEKTEPASVSGSGDASLAEPRATPVARRMAMEQGVDLAAIAPQNRGSRITKQDVKAALADRSSPVSGKIAATPAARRRARELNVDLNQLSGRGPHGRIHAGDVEAAANAASALTPAGGMSPAPIASEPGEGLPLSSIRRTIAARLSKSWQQAPHIMLTTSIDMTEADAMQQSLAEDFAAVGVRPSPTILIAKAVATALMHHPDLNGHLTEADDGLRWQPARTVNLGVAVALPRETGGGLVVPVISVVETLGLAALGRAIADVAGRARAGKLQPDDMSGGTFTLSNLGMYPVDHFTAVINPPQVAILAVGRASVQPCWTGQAFAPRPIMAVTLSADHRVVDGAVAAAFLAELKRLLEAPLRLLI
ncbi:MAG: 2-oxo acid dehydrogenase subunit E2 [Caldilineaceae bacterium]|nr:2-oxo acid dehydrogenase subunit E2 [Caldilineaceae bacterium]